MKAEISWQGTFDSAHMIPSHPKCGRLHGHTYHVEVRMTGYLPPVAGVPAYLVDYGKIKEVIDALDHRLIVPERLVTPSGDSLVVVKWYHTPQSLASYITLGPDQVYEIREPDSSAECLAHHLVSKLLSACDFDRMTSIQVDLKETPKTKASASWQRKG